MPDLTHLVVGDEVMLCEQRSAPRPVTVSSVGRLYLTVRGARGQFLANHWRQQGRRGYSAPGDS